MNAQIPAALFVSLALVSLSSADQTAKSTADPAPKFDSVVPAGPFIGKELKSPQYRLGRISDYVVDLQAGHLALLITVNNDRPAAEPQRAAFPLSAVKFDGQVWQLKDNVGERQVAAARRVAHESSRSRFHREAVRELYLAFESKPYWLTAAGDQFDGRDRMAFWSELRETRIHDKLGAVAGDINDLAIAPESGQIVYAAVDLGAGGGAPRYYAVPLGAFVVRGVGQPWTIELNQLELSRGDSFTAENWPRGVSRRWVEYVHVRYGRSATSGVQSGGKTTED